jgi:hypothetical protein
MMVRAAILAAVLALAVTAPIARPPTQGVIAARVHAKKAK